jgi:hypothetical protein
MTDERAWVVELVDAGVLVATEQVDANNNIVYRTGKFPDGAEGERLRKLYDQHIVTEIPSHWRDTTEENLEKKYAIIGGGE